MAVPTTLHISQPYMLCAPGRARGPGGAGLSPCRGSGRGRWGGGTGKGHGSLSGRPACARTRGSGRVKSDLHLVAAARTRPRAASHACPVASSPARGCWCCGGCGGNPGRATLHTTRHSPSGSRLAPRRWPNASPGARRGTCRPVKGTGCHRRG